MSGRRQKKKHGRHADSLERGDRLLYKEWDIKEIPVKEPCGGVRDVAGETLAVLEVKDFQKPS